MLKKYFQKHLLEAGCDEAGRGCLAGPVYAAAVILPHNFQNELLNDSKKLTDQERNMLRPIIEKEAICWAVATASNIEIDIKFADCPMHGKKRCIEDINSINFYIRCSGYSPANSFFLNNRPKHISFLIC